MVDGRTRGSLLYIFGDSARRLALVALCVLAMALMLAGFPRLALAQDSSEAIAEEKAASLDCNDFATQRGAQAILDRSPVASAGDPFELDEDGDGVVCETPRGEPGEAVAEDDTKLGAKTGGDLDCVDFPSQAAAQARLKADPSDPHGLDPENNGVACEFVPVPYADRAFDDAPVAAARSDIDLDCEDFEYQQEAQMVYLQDESDPNGLDGPNERAEKDKRFVGNGFACETLPLLESNVEEFGDTEGTNVAAPMALVAAWPHGGGLGFALDLAALLLVACGVLTLLVVRRARRSSGGSDRQ